VEDLAEEQSGEQRDEAHIELLAKNGHRQARLGDRIPGSLIQVLNFRLAQRAKEDLLAEFTKEEGKHKRLVAQDQHINLGCSQRNHRRVELVPLLHGVIRDPTHEGG